jgi:NitT/TauT family transport system substrate-binding protein
MMSMIIRTTAASLAASIMLSPGLAAAQDTLRVGMPEQMFLNLPDFVAIERGFFEDENLSIELVHIADSSIPVRALIAGELDIVQTGMPETLAANAAGADLVTLGGVHTGLHYSFFINPDAGIAEFEDIKGKRLGTSGPGTLPHVVLIAMMQEAGFTQDEINGVTWVNLAGSSARRNAIISGIIDATVAGFNPRAEAQEGIDVAFDVPGTLPDYVMTPWDTRRNILEERPDVLKRYIKASLLATRWVLDNREEALEVAAERFPYDEEELNAFYDFYAESIWNPNGMVTPEQAEYMQRLNVEGGLQQETRPTETILDTSLLEEVLEEIGEY